MNCKLYNNNIAVIVLAFATILAMSKSTFAEDAPVLPAPEIQQVENSSNDVDLFDFDETNKSASVDNNTLPDLSSETDNSDIISESNPNDEALISPQSPDTPSSDKSLSASLPSDDELVNEAIADEAMNVNTSTDNLSETEEIISSDASSAPKNVETTDEKASPDTSTSDMTFDEEKSQVVDAPKSPFESFGNAILSKVDNDLFNQMSKIEKQTTLLNLELKREEVKNRIEALRIQRMKAREEEEARKKAEEEKMKEAELERQLRMREAEEKLLEKEIELEKTRQAKVLNDYMNEMLMANQKWVEKNAELQSKIKELEEERSSIIKDFETKMTAVYNSVTMSTNKASSAKKAYDLAVEGYLAQIRTLKESLASTEEELRNSLKGDDNPFAGNNGITIDQNSIDMSEQYAIMDITGKGKDIVAKIVGKDGTTFIVHKGSMLKGGEVVTAISENFVAFDKKGQKGFLYTGGTVMDYEPTVAFNDAGKTQEIAEPNKAETQVIRNVRGAELSQSANTSQQSIGNENRTSKKDRKSRKVSNNKRGSSVGSFSSGMFIK